MNVLQQFINLEYYDICNKIYTYLEHPIIEKTKFKKIINDCKYIELEEDFVYYYFNFVLVDKLYFEDFYFEDFYDDDDDDDDDGGEYLFHQLQCTTCIRSMYKEKESPYGPQKNILHKRAK